MALALAPVAAHAAFPGLNGKIAWERDGQIWIADDGASNEQQLTTLGGRKPAWSPDGTRIAFVSDRNGSGDDIWVMNADGSDQHRVFGGPANERDPAWSPDGTRIVFGGFGDATPQLMTMNANGSAAAVLPPVNGDINAAPAWSPDGTRIAWRHFAGGTGISVRGLGADPGTPIVPDANDPSWFPDGSRLAVSRGGGADVWVAGTDGSGLVRLTDDPATDTQPAVSPDGRRIAFTSFRDGNFELYVMQADGSIEIRNTLTAAGVSDVDPDWQPIGPPPDVTSLSRLVAGAPGATLTVDGTGFVLRSVVRWNGADRPTTYVSPTRVTAALGAADVAAAGSAQVTVFTAPAGGGLSLPRTAVIDPAPAPPPPPALTLSQTRIVARWARSRVRGTLRVSGAAERAGRVEIALLRGSRVVQRRRVTLPAGPFSRAVPLERTLLPGAMRARVSEVGPVVGERMTPAQRAVRLRPPPEGVVARAFVSAIQNGPPARTLRGRARVFSHFRFAARPRRGLPITVRWTRGGRPAGTPVRKAFSRTVVGFIGARGRLPRGLYRSELRAGRRVVAVATVRVV